MKWRSKLLREREKFKNGKILVKIVFAYLPTLCKDDLHYHWLENIYEKREAWWSELTSTVKYDYSYYTKERYKW